MSCMVPRMLLACVQAANTVLLDINGSRFSGVSLGFEICESDVDGEGSHHLITSCCRSAREIQEAKFAS